MPYSDQRILSALQRLLGGEQEAEIAAATAAAGRHGDELNDWTDSVVRR